MGRKKSDFSKFFVGCKSKSKLPRIKCVFCSIEIARNGTRMQNHLLNTCKKIATDIKMKLKAETEKKQKRKSEKKNSSCLFKLN